MSDGLKVLNGIFTVPMPSTPKFDMASMTTGTVTIQTQITPESIAAMKDWVQAAEAEQERTARAFNEAIKRKGFDLDEGDMLILPPGSGLLPGVPQRYKHLVRESALATGAYLMRNPLSLNQTRD